MSLLREIQAGAVDGNVNISVLLRKCMILATRLNNEALSLWVEHELNGYARVEDLPEYRKIEVQSYGSFVGFSYQAKNLPIPPHTIPDKYREFATTHCFLDPISTYASLLEQPSGDRNDLRVNWPADLITFVGSNIYDDMTCVNAWRALSRGQIAGLVDAVRNRILKFALEIESVAPDVGESDSGPSPICNEGVTRMVTTHIYGNVTNLTVGGQTVTQENQVVVVQGDFSSLERYLASLGIESKDLTELENAIAKEGRGGAKGDISSKAKAWIERTAAKAGTGTFQVATSVASNLLSKALSSYLGLS